MQTDQVIREDPSAARKRCRGTEKSAEELVGPNMQTYLLRYTSATGPLRRPSVLARLQAHTGLLEEAEHEAPGLELDQVLEGLGLHDRAEVADHEVDGRRAQREHLVAVRRLQDARRVLDTEAARDDLVGGGEGER